MNPMEDRLFNASCRQLVKGLVEGDLVLESRTGVLAFRYTKPVKGPVIRENGHRYAAIVQKSDWPTEVPLLRRVK